MIGFLIGVIVGLVVGVSGLFLALRKNPAWLWPFKAAGKKWKVIQAIKDVVND